MTTLRINVTKDILEKSKNCSNTERGKNCAIALAIRDVFPDATVGTNSIYFYKDREKVLFTGETIVIKEIWTSMDLPTEASDFIDNFDISTPEERVKITPISFDIDVPNLLIDRISIDEIQEVLRTSKTMELV